MRDISFPKMKKRGIFFPDLRSAFSWSLSTPDGYHSPCQLQRGHVEAVLPDIEPVYGILSFEVVVDHGEALE